MRFDDERHPFTDRARRLEDIIGKLEGIAFGRWLEFSALGYNDTLHINGGGNNELRGFEGVPGLREFAAELNAATLPIRNAYALKLRQELANECIKIGAKALMPEVTQTSGFGK